MDLEDLSTDSAVDDGYVGLRWRLLIAGLFAAAGAALGAAISWSDGLMEALISGGTGALIAGGLAFFFAGYVILIGLVLVIVALGAAWNWLGLGGA